MIAFEVDITHNLQGLLEQLDGDALEMIVEAEAREHLGVMRAQHLDAPPGFHPAHLHRRTGQLADTSFISIERQGNAFFQSRTAVIHFPAEHARFHSGDGTRDVFAQSFRDRGDDILEGMTQKATALIDAGAR